MPFSVKRLEARIAELRRQGVGAPEALNRAMREAEQANRREQEGD